MKTRFLLSLLIIVIPFKIIGLSTDPVNGYHKEWKIVDSLTRLGQPRSALKVVTRIYELSVQEKNTPQFLKAVLYRIRLKSDFQENFFQETVNDLSRDFRVADEPAASVLHSILAEIYWKYYQNNLYRFQQRSFSETNRTDSLETWDLKTIIEAISNEYLLSLQNIELLKSIEIGKYKPILEVPARDDMTGKNDVTDHTSIELRPTLFDFIAHRALGYFSSSAGPPVRGTSQFRFDNPGFFSQTEDFIKINAGLFLKDDPLQLNRFVRYDSIVPAWIAFRIFQSLAAFHFHDKSPQALIDVELMRFEYIHGRASMAGKDSLYLAALAQFEKSNKSVPEGTRITFAIASFLNDQGGLYQPLLSEKHRWDRKNAVDVCDEALRRFPDSEGSKNCRMLKSSIEEKNLELTLESAVPIEKPFPALLEFRNLKEAGFRLIAVDPEQYPQRISGMNREELAGYLSSLPVEKQWSIRIDDTKDYQPHSMEIPVREIRQGSYVLFACSDPTFSSFPVFSADLFWVTDISYITQQQPDGNMGVFLLGRETGRPLKNASVEVLARKYDPRSHSYINEKRGDMTPDDNGYISIPPPSRDDRFVNHYLKISNGRDHYLSNPLFIYPVNDQPARTYSETRFFTDRSIYRPGQTIWFKGVELEKNGDITVLAVNRKSEVVFSDVNGQKIAQQSLITNEFGSFNGSFVIPSGILTGEMSISSKNGSITVLIEEYKRPTFEVKFNTVEGQYRAGQQVNVTGKAIAYTGSMVTGATVSYRVIRYARFPFWDRWYIPCPVKAEVEITNGTTFTDNSGLFNISFPAEPDYDLDTAIRPVFDFRILADITDQNGETRQGEQSLSIGYSSLLLDVILPFKLNLKKDSVIKILSTNLSGRAVQADVKISLERLQQPDRVFKPRYWKRPDMTFLSRQEFYSQFPYDIYANDDDPLLLPREMVSGFMINTLTDTLIKINPETLTKDNKFSVELKPGTYLLTLTTTDSYGQTVVKKTIFEAFVPDEKSMPVTALDWFVPLTTTSFPGKVAGFIMGSSEEDVTVVHEIWVKDKLMSRKFLKIHDCALNVDIMTLPEYRGNFSVNFLFVKHNRAFHHTQLVAVPHEDKNLNIVFHTFRDRMEPGQKEEWRITLSDASGKPVAAEFLSAMYDASLDIFRSNEWSFDIFPGYYSYHPWDINDAFTIARGSSWRAEISTGAYLFPEYYQLYWFGLGFPGGHAYKNRYGNMEKSPVMMQSDLSQLTPPMTADKGPEKLEESGRPAISEDISQEKLSVTPVIPIRRDFRETAFFYPTMRTDSAGQIMLTFTAPESLTRWNLLGLAYTKDLKYGLLKKELVTRKELMVFPNAPRFVRQGDTLFLSTRVVNISDHDLPCRLLLSLTDPIHETAYNHLVTGAVQQDMTVKKGESAALTWRLIIPENPSLSVLQYRIIAQSGNFSDGEEKSIPVLTDRMLVTETLPLPVNGKGSFDFSFTKLKKNESTPDQTFKNYRLVLEFAGNPAWYAIQALPQLNDRMYDNADAIFASFYSNSIASHIANSNPKIKAVFESWKSLTPDALLSDLEKNQSLKTALLEQTPWVMEAKNESVRKQKLGQYFDLNNLNQNLRQNLEKLVKLQQTSGGWSWFEGMPESRWITQTILTGLGHLDHLGIASVRKDEAIWEMITGAVSYLDRQLDHDLEIIKKNHPGKVGENHLSPLQVQYLYARSYFMDNPQLDRPLGTKVISTVPASFEYFREQAVKYWVKQDLHQQGMIALALNRLGDTEIPALILKSLSEKALHSPEMGMYWAQSEGWNLRRAPVETQALLIEAFDEISEQHKTIEEMKVWLLKQKQTQNWKSTRATVEAIYALLLRGTDLLSENEKVKIVLGAKNIDPSKFIDIKTEAGTGYFQCSWEGDEITPDMSKIRIIKESDGVAWGALYWQYFENLEKITIAETALKLRKEVFLETNTPSGPVLEPLSDSEPKRNNDPFKNPETDRFLKVGDKLKIRITIVTDRDLEYIHMKDMRAAGLEPLTPTISQQGYGLKDDRLSGYHFQDGLCYYQSITDVAASFFFEYIPKGTYVFEYPLVVNAAGNFSNGITTVQSLYNPEFSSHSEGIRLDIKK